ncbi:hypothetical protein [uncultured Pseudodesulfovibrio sp.]|uniref:hypothetical protein n=1 Tax=uncultured Pseudodesulfovibrio sp. TaxID=2035858 RepID=UPI0029C78A94|nr:hypothetical protein [uncultured Pseudodesulfovibrio sp.]
MASYDFTGTWKSSYFLSEIVAYITQEGDNISGHAIVKDVLFGKKNVYHFNGTASGLIISAHHHSGRTFEGKAVGKHLALGILTTRRGFQAKLKAKRVSLTPKAG